MVKICCYFLNEIRPVSVVCLAVLRLQSAAYHVLECFESNSMQYVMELIVTFLWQKFLICKLLKRFSIATVSGDILSSCRTKLKTELGGIMHKEFNALQTCDILCDSFTKENELSYEESGRKV